MSQHEDAGFDLAEQLRAQVAEHRKRAAELTSLYDLALRLSGVHELGALLQDTVTYARSLLGVDVAYLALVEPDGSLTIKVTDGSMGPQLRGVALGPRTGLAGRVVELAEPVQVRDYLGDTELEHLGAVDDVAVAEGLRSILGAPLRLRGDVLGVLMVSQRDLRSFPPSEVSLLSSLAAIAAVAIDSARLIGRYRDAATELEETNRQLRRHAEGIHRAATLHETLLDAASRGGGVDDVIRSLSAVFGGSILFADHEDHVVTSASGGEPTSGARLQPVEGLTASAVFSDPARRRTVLGDAEITVPVGTVREYFGALQVVPDGPLQDADVRMLERAAMTIALVASTARAVSDAERRTTVELLEQLVSRQVDDEASFARRSRPHGLAVEVPHVVAVVDPSPQGSASPLRWAQDLVVRHGGLAERVFGRVVVVARCDEEQLRSSLGAGSSVGTTGIAGPAVGALGLAAAYEEALACVTALVALERVGDSAAAADLGPYRFLLSRAGRSDAARFVRQAIGPLLDHDRDRGTELVRTADVFLGKGRQHAATATALSVHANTLYQRLDRITTHLGPDWRTGDRALDVQMALRLHRLMERTGP